MRFLQHLGRWLAALGSAVAAAGSALAGCAKAFSESPVGPGRVERRPPMPAPDSGPERHASAHRRASEFQAEALFTQDWPGSHQ